MSGMQTTSEVRKLIAQQISCEGPTLLKWLQTWSLASRNLGRILDPENTGTTTFSTLSAGSRLVGFERRGTKADLIALGSARSHGREPPQLRGCPGNRNPKRSTSQGTELTSISRPYRPHKCPK